MKRSHAPSQLAKRSKTQAKARSKPQRSLVASRGAMIPIGFPARLKIKHRYCENVQITSTTGTIGQYKFACNGLYDPNLTSTGHQPMYFDVCNTIYNHYTVLWSRIKVYIVGGNATPNTCILAVHVDDDTSTSADITAIQEHSTAFVRTLPYGSQDVVTLYNKWSAGTYFGGNPLANDNLQGSGAANPSELSVYTISVNALSAATQTVNVRVEIDYVAVWDELKTLDVN